MHSASVRRFVGCLLLTLSSANDARAVPVAGSIEQAIVGGQALALDEVTPTALIGTCDATLVAPHLLVTAAHCLPDRPTQAWFGSSRARAAFQVPIERCVAHPDYRKVLGADVAFCELTRDVSEIEPALVIGACEPADERVPGAQLLLVGHGYPGGGNADGAARIARSVEVQVGAVVSEGRELVVGDSARGACHGDSGGSAFALSSDGTPRLVGVISRRGPDTQGEVGADCASTTLVTALRPKLAWLASATDLEPTECGLGEDALEAAVDRVGCSATSAPWRSRGAATSWLLLVCVVLLRARRGRLGHEHVK